VITKNYLIDTHCHLNFPDFKDDREEVINRALQAGVSKIILASASVIESEKNVQLASKHSGIWTAVGIHPHMVDVRNRNVLLKEELIKLEKQLEEKAVVAIGEIGLDYSSIPLGEDTRIKQEQKALFESQLQLAQDSKLPAVIHSRDSEEDTLSIIKNFPNVPKVAHCFTYPYNIAKRFLEQGCLVSFTGIIAFPNSAALQEVVKKVPLQSIVLETDAPFLAPPPHRGQRNEPAYVRIIAEKIAALKSISFNEVCQKTSETSERFFRKIK